MGGVVAPKALIFDVDEVILAWRPAFLSWMARQGHRVVGGCNTCFNFTDALPLLDEGALCGWVERFNRSTDYALLQTLPGAVESIRRLVGTEFPTWTVAAVTATGHGFATIRRRVDALTNLGCFDELHCIGVREAKAPYFARYPRGSIVFEDSTRHALAALELGHRVVFFDYPYNRDCPDFLPGLIKVQDWELAEVAACCLGTLTDAEVLSAPVS